MPCIFSPEFCYHGLQKEGSLYVCELCQKYGKGFGSEPVSSRVDPKAVSLYTDLPSQLPLSHGKVCYLPQCDSVNDFNFASSKGKLIYITDCLCFWYFTATIHIDRPFALLQITSIFLLATVN